MNTSSMYRPFYLFSSGSFDPSLHVYIRVSSPIELRQIIAKLFAPPKQCFAIVFCKSTKVPEWINQLSINHLSKKDEVTRKWVCLKVGYIQYILIYVRVFSITIQFTTTTSSTAQGGGASFKNRKHIGEVGGCESRMAERIHWWIERWLELCFLEWLQWLRWSPHHNCWM